jgi:competence protein ComFC
MKLNIINWLINIFFPQQCLQCQSIQKNRVCDTCFTRIFEKNSYKMGQLQITPKMQLIDYYYYFLYEGPIKEILHDIKFKKSISLATQFSKQFSTLSLPSEIDHNWIIIPIPSHANRIKERGFNHISLLFQDFVTHHTLKVMPILRRKKHTKALFELNSQQRQDELESAFEILFPEHIRNQNIILIDDIITSGATIAQAHDLLVLHGAAQVKALSIAFTPLS